MYVLYTESLKACLALLLFSYVVLNTVLLWLQWPRLLCGGGVTPESPFATNSSFDKSTDGDV